jgi:hypothetical protein
VATGLVGAIPGVADAAAASGVGVVPAVARPGRLRCPLRRRPRHRDPVTDGLRAAGLHPGPPGTDRLSIPLRATAAEAGAAFGDPFSSVPASPTGGSDTATPPPPRFRPARPGVVGLDGWPGPGTGR